MSDKIQMTEDQARELWQSLISVPFTKTDIAIKKMKELGFIKKSAREEAEEIMREYCECGSHYCPSTPVANLIEKLYDAILEQDELIKQLKES